MARDGIVDFVAPRHLYPGMERVVVDATFEIDALRRVLDVTLDPDNFFRNWISRPLCDWTFEPSGERRSWTITIELKPPELHPRQDTRPISASP